jgi:hypothetical protein
MDPIINKFNSPEIENIQSPYKNGLNFLGLSDIEVERIGQNIQNFFNEINKERGRNINRNPITMLRGAIFAVGSRNLNNEEWMEHCSSSLREIFHVWNDYGKLNGLQNDYRDCYFDNNAAINYIDKLKFLWNYYDFFSGIDHHEQEKWRHALIRLKRIDKKHTSGLKDDEFIEIVKDFFKLLKMLFYNKNEST